MAKLGSAKSFGLGVACAAAVGIGLGFNQPGSGGAGSGLDRTSYAIGHDLAVSTLDRLELDQVDFSSEALVQGFRDAMGGGQPAFGDAEMLSSLMVLEREVNERHARQRISDDPVFRAHAEENQRKSGEFAGKFADDARTQSLPGGILYRVQASGDGDSPDADGTVRIKFEARLIDGTLIGDEAEYSARLDGMIEGAREALLQMKTGDVWIVLLPPEKAFGLGGRLPDIGPNEAVLAEITLLGVD